MSQAIIVLDDGIKPETITQEWPTATGAIYMWTQGNYSCDCNRSLFISEARTGKSDYDSASPCGDTIKLVSITIDGTELEGSNATS